MCLLGGPSTVWRPKNDRRTIRQMADALAVLESGRIEALLRSIEATPLPMVVTDYSAPDNPIIAVNDGFEELTGYSRELAIGNNCRFLAGPATEKDGQAELRRAIEGERPSVVELTNYRKNGIPFRNVVMISPVPAGDAPTRFFVGAMMECSVVGTLSGLRTTRARALVSSLTPRPRQVLALMAAGYRNKDIASLLRIHEKTVKMHRERIFKLLGVATSGEAIRLAVEAELLFSDPDRS